MKPDQCGGRRESSRRVPDPCGSFYDTRTPLYREESVLSGNKRGSQADVDEHGICKLRSQVYYHIHYLVIIFYTLVMVMSTSGWAGAAGAVEPPAPSGFLRKTLTS